MYFEALPKEVLDEDPSRVVHIVSLASEWQLRDVVEACRDFVTHDVDDIGLLENLACSLSFNDVGLAIVRQSCHERLRKLRDRAEVQRLNHNCQSPSDSGAAGFPAGRQGGRWAVGSGGSGMQPWSTPLSCPRGFGL